MKNSHPLADRLHLSRSLAAALSSSAARLQNTLNINIKSRNRSVLLNF